MAKVIPMRCICKECGVAMEGRAMVLRRGTVSFDKESYPGAAALPMPSNYRECYRFVCRHCCCQVTVIPEVGDDTPER